MENKERIEKTTAKEKINYIVDENNIVTEWIRIPFDTNLPYIELGEDEDIYVGFSKIVDGKLISNKEQYETWNSLVGFQSSKQRQMYQTLNELNNTDYKAIKYAEGWISEADYAPIKAQREELRRTVRELETEIAELETAIEQAKKVQ